MKKAVKYLRNFINNIFVKFTFYILCLGAILWITGVFSDMEHWKEKIAELFSTQETVSVLVVGLLSLALMSGVKLLDYILEESLKIEDNHHNIISQYSKHSREFVSNRKNFYNKDGAFVTVDHINKFKLALPKPKAKDKYSDVYKSEKKDIKAYVEDEKLVLPSVNVFANVKGDTELVFDDKNELYQLPDFVIDHAADLLEAHKNSKRTNNYTIRLNDFDYNDGVVTLHTQRSMYYHMLVTNRCMDYKFCGGLTIRDLYEYKKEISDLGDSVLGNQIGINGVVISKDGYVLIEKRDRNKTIWKNKFAQSISLALKESSVKLGENRAIGNTYEDANSNFRSIICKTIKDNFGITEDMLKGFELKDNFLGIARDLLEGGKPNIYFYVTVDKDAREIAKIIKERCKKDDESAFATGKLTSDYYFVPLDEIKVNFDYELQFNRKRAIKVYRRVYPRCKRSAQFADWFKYHFTCRFKPIFKRECGEALLVTIAYLELCRDRIEAIKK